MLLLIILILFIQSPSGKQTNPCNELQIRNHFVSWGHEKITSARKIEAIIIHSSFNALTPDSFDVDGILKEYKQVNVSPHYIINREGTVYRFVPDEEVAYHAGRSRLPDGTTDVNRVSIGIELINTESDPPTEEQYVSLRYLIECLKSKYPVKFILGHSDIAPGRKTDPWNFDWKKIRSGSEDSPNTFKH